MARRHVRERDHGTIVPDAETAGRAAPGIRPSATGYGGTGADAFPGAYRDVPRRTRRTANRDQQRTGTGERGARHARRREGAGRADERARKEA